MLPQGIAIYLQPRMIGLMLLGVASGLPLALTGSTLTMWLAEAGVDKTAIGLFASVATPYALKWLWAPLVDALPLPWLSRALGRRRAWMALCQAALPAALLWVGLCRPEANPWLVALAALAVATVSATFDLVLDAYRVEILPAEDYAAGAASIVLGYRVGMLVSGAGGLILAEYYGWFGSYAVMAALFAALVAVIWWLGEPEAAAPLTRPESPLAWLRSAVVAPLADLLRQPGWGAIAAFIVAFKLGDAFLSAMNSPFFRDMGFSKTEVAQVAKTFGFAGAIIGAMVAGSLTARYGLFRILLLSGVLQMLSNLVYLWQAHVGHHLGWLAFTMGVENFCGGMASAVFVAYLSSLCNLRFTATQYALLSSLAALGRTFLSTSSGWVAEHWGWQEFFITSTVLALPGVVLIFLVRRYQTGPGARPSALADD